MSKTLPKRHVEALVGLAKEAAARRVLFPDEARALDYAQAALAPRKRTPAQCRTQAVKREKKATKREQRADVRAQVMARAGGQCEGRHMTANGRCLWHCAGAPLELDHFFGRGRVESAETCWALCSSCHHVKTRNYPSSAYWLERFIAHAERHGYHTEAERARARLEGIVAVRAASAAKGARNV